MTNTTWRLTKLVATNPHATLEMADVDMILTPEIEAAPRAEHPPWVRLGPDTMTGFTLSVRDVHRITGAFQTTSGVPEFFRVDGWMPTPDPEQHPWIHCYFPRCHIRSDNTIRAVRCFPADTVELDEGDTVDIEIGGFHYIRKGPP